jgi:hypothetical protein
LFDALTKKQISILLITQSSSEHSISVGVSVQDTHLAKIAVDAEFEEEINAQLLEPLIIEKDLSIIAIVGAQMRNHPGISGKMFGVTRQQIIFTPRETSPRISVQWPYKEGISPGGTHQNLWQYSTATVVTRTGGNSIYGGGGGGGAGGQFSNLAGAPGGNSLFNSNTGGAGANYALANSGAGGGGAGIAGNGGAGSGNTGGAGGSGGGGGGGGGIVNANVGTGGAGGSGAVLIYY